MKKKKTLVFTGIGSVALAPALILILGSMAVKWKTQPLPEMAQKEFKITQYITYTELQIAFKRARKDLIPIIIYIVKQSPDTNMRDISFRFLSTDSGNKHFVIGKPWTEKQLETEAGYYVRFLKQNRVPENKAMLAYGMMLDRSTVNDSSSRLELSIAPFGAAKFLIKMRGGSKNSGVKTEMLFSLKRDSCQVPPGCATWIRYIPNVPQLNDLVRTTYQ